jgi:hypothetical protein
MRKDKMVQGFALYLEFDKEPSSNNVKSQILIIPAGYNEDDILSRQTILWRVVSDIEPKKQWRTLHSPSITGLETKTQLVESTWNSSWLFSPFRWLTSEYKTKSAFFIEVSKKDYTDLIQNKTPTKLIYRMNQIRTTKEGVVA